jgi:hypothetical protein
MKEMCIEMVPLNDLSKNIQYKINNNEWIEYCYLKFNLKVSILMRFIKFIFSFYDNYGELICNPPDICLLHLKKIVIEPYLLYDCEICDDNHGKKLDKLHALLANKWDTYLCTKDLNILNDIKFKLLTPSKGGGTP